MEKIIKKLIKKQEKETPSELNQFKHWVYFEEDIAYINLMVEVYNGITYEVDRLFEEILPESEKDLEWYVDKVEDFYEFVNNYIELVQSY